MHVRACARARTHTHTHTPVDHTTGTKKKLDTAQWNKLLFSYSVTSSPLHLASLSTLSQSLLKLMFIKSVMPFNHLILCCPLSSCLQSFPASGSFLMSWLFASGGQSIGASSLASVLPMNSATTSFLLQCYTTAVCWRCLSYSL